ncbi:hypothetical protein ACH4E7_21470 [Kitasatospora sp. NPDC018058]|uniref:hypothetical protein n=1 Tax=Kitasatospora sp. NPDC018058 TaxID=3364025 RepID=UPI0037BEDEAC
MIRARHFKNVTDTHGHHVSAGEARSVPWVAITPVVNAIRVLERMVPEGELLFAAAHQFGQDTGALQSGGLNTRIKDFAAWANREAAARQLPGQHIPDDPLGPVQAGRFRRTLAWHIARQPGGLVALAIQYGHMRTVLDARTSARYGTRSRGGIHTVLDVETALAAAAPPPACATNSPPANASPAPPPDGPSPQPPTSPASKAASSPAPSPPKPTPTSPARASSCSTTPTPC